MTGSKTAGSERNGTVHDAVWYGYCTVASTRSVPSRVIYKISSLSFLCDLRMYLYKSVAFRPTQNYRNKNDNRLTHCGRNYYDTLCLMSHI